MGQYRRAPARGGSFLKDRIKRPPIRPAEFTSKIKKIRDFEINNFPLGTFNDLSNTQKGILIVTVLLLAGGVAIANAQSQPQPSLKSTALAPRQHPICPLPQIQGVRGVQRAFFAQPPLQNTCHSSRSPRPPRPTLFYKGLIVRDVSSDIRDCKQKSQGLSAGKVCKIGSETYYLKVVETEGAHPGRKTKSLLGIYNLALIRESLDVTVPTVFIAYEKNGSYQADEDTVAPASFYVASRSVDQFITGAELMKKIHREQRINEKKYPFSTQNFSSIKREQIVAKIGEHGLAKLAVAGTFFQDLVNNDGNWGFDGRGLVIVDVDNSPATFETYLAEAVRMPRNIELDFSVNTIIAMKNNYLGMLQKGLPVIHRSVDMKGMFYQSLVKIYIEACDAALIRITETYPTLRSDIPTSVVNDILSESYLEAMNCARRNGLFSTYKRYDMEDKDQGSYSFSSARS